ncbi:hypothetical protein Taro_030204 [Colocasia esculenta]|uniref:RNase H type-1 domain-containing protein n=1 Tax=Colocasia esculenta TaxID=4460 RepID=A0A843VVG9_COLES|nr:hypothetical protein [Colocasia esculenta]
MPVYLASASCIPKIVLSFIECLYAAFFWAGSPNDRHRHWVSWSTIQKPILEGEPLCFAGNCFTEQSPWTLRLLSVIFLYPLAVVVVGVLRMDFKCSSTSQQLDAIRDLGLFVIAPLKMSKFVRWIPPIYGLMLNVDGASKGNPEPCGGGGIFRDSHGNVSLAFSHYYGVGSGIVAEVRAMHDGVLLAVEKGLIVTNICSDSLTLVASLRTGVVLSWDCYRWWRTVLDFVQLHGVQVTHVFREANQVAIALANFAYSMRCNEVDRQGEWFYFTLMGWTTLD